MVPWHCPNQQTRDIGPKNDWEQNCVVLSCCCQWTMCCLHCAAGLHHQAQCCWLTHWSTTRAIETTCHSSVICPERISSFFPLPRQSTCDTYKDSVKIPTSAFSCKKSSSYQPISYSSPSFCPSAAYCTGETSRTVFSRQDEWRHHSITPKSELLVIE